ncbi:AraC family transcriptional regulator [Planococcus shenhongbingii]|uniref:AraC family transcriptional regulator n=1 Tax=Planococcus shenhongbingii TaxID=3058398 RepID=UPI00262375DA|nr:AraC family transcriptional regulator [Planococcus sp. N016]WKA58473.1 AraC family transcriptional regulator [Planococcus sp. N016]
MGWVESLQQAIDYMEDHLDEPIAIEQIAKRANASVFHFQRTFTILTDMTVGEYLRGRRLTLAAHELSNTDNKIIDIAYKYGYDTPEAFSKAFRRQHGITPSEARRNLGGLKSYNRLVLQVKLRGAEPMKYKIVERDGFKVVGFKRTFSTANDENMRGIPQMWRETNANGLDEKLFRVNSGEIEGVLGVCVAGEGASMDYWIAAETDREATEEFEEMEIPASKWGVFEVHGPMPDAMQNAWKKIFTEWFPSNPYEYAGTPELEVYPHADPYQPDSYSEIWIPLKNK